MDFESKQQQRVYEEVKKDPEADAENRAVTGDTDDKNLGRCGLFTPKALTMWHAVATVAMAVQTGLLLFYERPVMDIPATVGFPARDAHTGVIASPRVKKIGSVPVADLLALILALSAAGHFATAFTGIVCPKIFESIVVKNQANKLRWIEYALSGAVISMLVAMLAGIYDIILQLLIGASFATCMLIALSIEMLPRELVGKRLPQKPLEIRAGPVALAEENREQLLESQSSSSILTNATNGSIEGKASDMLGRLHPGVRSAGLTLCGVASSVLGTAWFVVLCYLCKGTRNLNESYVDVAFLILTVLYLGIAMNLYLERFCGKYSFAVAEFIYIFLSLIAKSAFAWNIYGGVHGF